MYTVRINRMGRTVNASAHTDAEAASWQEDRCEHKRSLDFGEAMALVAEINGASAPWHEGTLYASLEGKVSATGRDARHLGLCPHFTDTTWRPIGRYRLRKWMYRGSYDYHIQIARKNGTVVLDLPNVDGLASLVAHPSHQRIIDLLAE